MRFVMDWLHLNAICDETVDLIYRSSATVLEVLAVVSSNKILLLE